MHYEACNCRLRSSTGYRIQIIAWEANNECYIAMLTTPIWDATKAQWSTVTHVESNGVVGDETSAAMGTQNRECLRVHAMLVISISVIFQ